MNIPKIDPEAGQPGDNLPRDHRQLADLAYKTLAEARSRRVDYELSRGNWKIFVHNRRTNDANDAKVEMADHRQAWQAGVAEAGALFAAAHYELVFDPDALIGRASNEARDGDRDE